jgi:sensor histidine kinase YesM
MTRRHKLFTLRDLPKALAIAIAFNTAIATLLYLISEKHDFWTNFIYSQCIGLSVFIFNALILSRVKSRNSRLVILSLSLPGSIALGLTLAFWISGKGSWQSPFVLNSMLIGLFFSVIGSIAFFLSERIQTLDHEVRRRRLQQIEIEKREIEANLRMLQAQIEPHFLFNTLANVSSLIEMDPVRARELLDKLIDWLRIALARTRSEQTILDDELNMLENYLEILGMRFGERLRWHISVPDEVRALPFPPMLLQPLVENAVRHGIEPKVGGGKVTISAYTQYGKLHVQVDDDGVGFAHKPGSGAGLENIWARLRALYGDKASLSLHSLADGGVSASLEIPL